MLADAEQKILGMTIGPSSRDASARDLFLDAEQKILGMTTPTMAVFARATTWVALFPFQRLGKKTRNLILIDPIFHSKSADMFHVLNKNQFFGFLGF